MGLAPFARLEQRVNRAVLGRLANAVAVAGGGEPFGVVFDRAPAAFDQLVEAAGPQASFDLAKAPGLAYGSALLIDSVSYTVTGGLEPDSSGWVTVQLRKA